MHSTSLCCQVLMLALINNALYCCQCKPTAPSRHNHLQCITHCFESVAVLRSFKECHSHDTKESAAKESAVWT